ncbi:Os10g0516200 [Oryza sativa Japonica Group]|uniref:Os10g0516200 protein n=1 Tax=Oryza sativa subsp. japonica TaxID=39947 RepID=C7J816_ORYSJ|nr:Os10g0516200 [Oryza sativa Japonica Group]|eukprot:NP_001176240.1 Os10g0516200 [Oryza sativa Japonica Group]
MWQRYRFLCCGCGGNMAASAAGDRGCDDDADCGGGSGGGGFGEEEEGGKGGVAGAARRLSWAQVEAMTGGFTSAVVGEGGFSTVYLARVAGALAAVKVHRSSERLHRVFRQELDALLRVRHPHIVRLLAFCEQQGGLGAPVLARASPRAFARAGCVPPRRAEEFFGFFLSLQRKACWCWSSRRTGTCTSGCTAAGRPRGRCRGRGARRWRCRWRGRWSTCTTGASPRWCTATSRRRTCSSTRPCPPSSATSGRRGWGSPLPSAPGPPRTPCSARRGTSTRTTSAPAW